MPFGSQSSSDSGLRWQAIEPRPGVFIAFRLSVLFGHRKPRSGHESGRRSSLPFGSQSSSDKKPAVKTAAAPAKSSLPFGSQSSSDTRALRVFPSPGGESSLPFGSQSSSDTVTAEKAVTIVSSLHCLSALSPLRTVSLGRAAKARPFVFIAFRLSVLFGLLVPCLRARRWWRVFIAFRLSVLFGHRGTPELAPERAVSSLPFGSQSSSDVTLVAIGSRGTVSSSLPFGSQSSSDAPVSSPLPDSVRQVFIAFRLSVLFGLDEAQRGRECIRLSSLPFGSQSSSDERFSPSVSFPRRTVFIAFRLSVLFGRNEDRRTQPRRHGVFIAFRLSVLFGPGKWAASGEIAGVVFIAFRLSVLFGPGPVHGKALPSLSLHCLSALSPLRTGSEIPNSPARRRCLHCLSALSPLRTGPVARQVESGPSVFIAFRLSVLFGLVWLVGCRLGAVGLHCLSALSPLRTNQAGCEGTRHVRESSLPFGSQSSSDPLQIQAFVRSAGSSLPSGSQSSSDALPSYVACPSATGLHCLSALSPLRTTKFNLTCPSYALRLHCLSALSPLRTARRRIVSGRLSKGLHCLSALSPLRTRFLLGKRLWRGRVFIAFRLSVLFGREAQASKGQVP